MSAVTTRGNDLVVNAGEKLTITTEYGQRYKGGIIKVLEKDGWVADNEEIRKEETTSSIGSLSGWKEFPQEKEFSISRKELKNGFDDQFRIDFTIQGWGTGVPIGGPVVIS